MPSPQYLLMGAEPLRTGPSRLPSARLATVTSAATFAGARRRRVRLPEGPQIPAHHVRYFCLSSFDRVGSPNEYNTLLQPQTAPVPGPGAAGGAGAAF